MNRTGQQNSTHIEREASSTDKPCTYVDCLLARVSAPQYAAGKSIFQLLMVGGMVSIMVTFNGVMHAGLGFFVTSHWLYPLAFCLAFALRVLVANRLMGHLTAQRPFTRLSGFPKSLAVTAANVLFMATLMTCVMSLLLNGPDGLGSYLLRSVPVSLAVAFAVNVLIVAPAVKYLYHRVLTPSAKAHIVAFLQRNPTGWAGIFTN